MRFVPAQTEAFGLIGIDPDTMELQIVFHDGNHKSYGRVTQGEAIQLTYGKAPGRYFNENIRKRACVDVMSLSKQGQESGDRTAMPGAPLAEGAAGV